MYKLTPLGYRLIRIYFGEYYDETKLQSKLDYISRQFIVDEVLQPELNRFFDAMLKRMKKYPEKIPPINVTKNSSGKTYISEEDYELIQNIPSNKIGRIKQIICHNSSFIKEAAIYEVKRQTLILEYQQIVRCIDAFNRAIEEFNSLYIALKGKDI